MSKLYENIKIRRRKEELSSQEYSQAVKLIKGENYISILSSLEERVIIEFLKISSNSENIYFSFDVTVLSINTMFILYRKSLNEL